MQLNPQTKAVIFGGIGTLTETSEFQREAFNQAFKEAGLDWHWASEDYKLLLAQPGGARRIQDYAATHGEPSIDGQAAASLHRRKTELFQQRVSREGLTLRPGVDALVSLAGREGLALAIASTTDRLTIRTLLEATGLAPDQFAVILDREAVAHSKPAPDVYARCLEDLALEASQCLAIEDSESGLLSAHAAGVPCIVTPGANTLDQDYSQALACLESLAVLEPAVLNT